MSDSIQTEIPGDDNVYEDAINKVAEATLGQIPPPELERYKISFADYKEDKCTVNVMNGRNAQMVVKIVKNIGLNFKNQEHFSRSQGSSRMEIKPVINKAPYDTYYKGLPDEIQDSQEVKEIKYVDTRPNKEADLRIFYYSLSNIFYVLAITANAHENLDHRVFQTPRLEKKRWRR